MILVLETQAGYMNLKLFSCGPDLETAVDHLHFTLEITVGPLYKEEYDGVINVGESRSLEELVEKVLVVYETRQLLACRDGVKNGTISLQ